MSERAARGLPETCGASRRAVPGEGHLKRERAHFGWLDVVVLLAIAAAGAWVFWRVRTGVDYDWDWPAIGDYFFRYDRDKERWVPNLLVEGFLATIRLSIWAVAVASVIGVVIGLFRTSGGLFLRMTGRAYVECIRNLPPLVLVFIGYFFVSDQILPVIGVDDFVRSLSPAVQDTLAIFLAPPSRFSAFIAAVFTLALYEAAYIAEIVRGGIASIERGQWEAGHALGLTWWQQMRYVIGPQAIQRMVPPLASQFISTIKDSAIVSVISIQELTFQGMQLMAATYLTFEVWITIAAMYLVLTLSCSMAARKLEAWMSRGHH
ncbi:MAG: amino acid ABC transporter permease [Desulfatibacillaceae bacterium]